MTAKLLKFTPKDRQGDPDFPGIPALAHFYRQPGRCRVCDGRTAPGAEICLDCAIAISSAEAME